MNIEGDKITPRKSRGDEIRKRVTDAPANIRDRPAVNSAGPRNAYRDIDLAEASGVARPSWNFGGGRGLETGQPEVVDVHATFPRRGYYRPTEPQVRRAVPVTLSRRRALISQPATL